MRTFRSRIALIVAIIVFALTSLVPAQTTQTQDATQQAQADDSSGDSTTVRPLQRLAQALPPSISDGLDIEGWAWLADLQNNAKPTHNYYDAEFSLEMTKSFDQRIAFTGEGNFIDANGNTRAELEQGFVSAMASERTQTLLTVGKFNSNFGIEPHDFWNRVTGTTSLLYAAQPQDLLGVMVTQPIGDSGLFLRPFISADFQGAYDFDQPPSAGLMVEYKPSSKLDLAVTNWVGPGFVGYEGRPLHPPFSTGGYGDSGDDVTENWQGPNLYAQRGSTLYFVEGKVSWRPTSDLTLAAEYLFARTGTSEDDYGWQGWMVLADYDVTDRLHLFARYSALNDPEWFITGVYQKAREVSGGAGYSLADGVEVRGEYRHDFSNVTPDFDSVSVHLTFGF